MNARSHGPQVPRPRCRIQRLITAAERSYEPPSRGPPAPCSPGPTLAVHACTSARCSTMWNRRSTIHATASCSTVAVTRTAALLIATGCLARSLDTYPAPKAYSRTLALCHPLPKPPSSPPLPLRSLDTQACGGKSCSLCIQLVPHEHSLPRTASPPPWMYRDSLRAIACGTAFQRSMRSCGFVRVALDTVRIKVPVTYLHGSVFACWNVCTN